MALQMYRITCGEASQVTIVLNKPDNFILVKNDKGKVYYSRKFQNIFGVGTMNFNIADKGVYTVYTNQKVNNYRLSKIPFFQPLPLPPMNHNYAKKVKIVKVGNNKKQSIAAIKPIASIMYVQEQLQGMPVFAQRFVIGHELGHHFYSGEGLASEENCDKFAINYVMKNGGNLSTCFVTMEAILKRNATNLERMKSFINGLSLTYQDN